jgi:hypothetical protein
MALIYICHLINFKACHISFFIECLIIAFIIIYIYIDIYYIYMVDGASILDFAPGPQKVRNGPGSTLLELAIWCYWFHHSLAIHLYGLLSFSWDLFEFLNWA